MVRLDTFKRFFLFSLIGSLIVSAMVAVVTVLIGEFNDIAAKVLVTLAAMMFHILISLAFIWDNDRQHTFDRLAFFSNTVFVLIIVSFITSIFRIWDLVSLGTFWHLYQSYFVLAFAALHGNMLHRAFQKELYMDMIIYVNYIFIAIVVIMFQPIIFIDNASSVLDEMFFRIFAASAIIDGTLSLLTIIFYKLYIQKHPEEQDVYIFVTENGERQTTAGSGSSVWLVILIIYLVLLALSTLQSFFF